MSAYRVLIVDDMLVNLKILEKILQSAGYETVSVTSGKQALEIVETSEFHCILLDIVMPEMDGFEVITRMKEMPIVADIPVIFITGEEGPEATVRGFEAGAVDYITKPFHPHEVQVRVKSHIRLFTTIRSLATAQAETLKQINSAQNSLLKKPEDFPEANFAAYYCSLHAAGGDIYDIVQVSDSRIGYFVGDFAGHQISTGFLTSSVKALLHQNCNGMNTPAQSMSMVNSVLCELMKPGQYLTGCYAELNKLNNELTVVNMGHPPLVVMQFGGKIFEVGRGGDVLGVFEDAFYREDKIHLLPQDRFVLYTDGLIEGKSVWSAYVRPLRKMLETYPELSRDDFLEKLVRDTEAFRGEVTDDIMVLVADIPGEIPAVQSEIGDFTYNVKFPSINRFTSQIARDMYDWILQRAEIKDVYGLKLVINEALSNAVIHGNGQSVSKWVTVEIEIENTSLRIRVEDQGRGFNWRGTSQAVSDMGDVKAVHGRGLSLFKAYGYEVKYNERGNSVTLEIYY